MNIELANAAAKAERMLGKKGIHLTLGGEPTYVPFDPRGEEWHITAVGPTKLEYARAFAEAILREIAPGALLILTPGKLYPGELDARWALKIVWLKSGRRILSEFVPRKNWQSAAGAIKLKPLKRLITEGLRLEGAKWIEFDDPVEPGHIAHVLPLDHSGKRWVTARWNFPGMHRPALTTARGPAGLRLPLASLDARFSKRALVLDVCDRALHVFIPPLRQKPFLKLVRLIGEIVREMEISPVNFEGYLPADEGDLWATLGLGADPGVLEINLPVCESWREYAEWIERLDACAAVAGLRSSKQVAPSEAAGTGGGSHLLFGGRTLATNPFFTRPEWIASLCRYHQHHPSLAYLFTGKYVGPACQAPRVDETLTPFLDLEMAYRALEMAGNGEDRRALIGETLRHLHVDASGSSHRSEICFDKFWAANTPGGCNGLVEFRAIEALPEPLWNCAAAALFLAIIARLADAPFREPLRQFGAALHDQYLLPQFIRADMEDILADLARHGITLPRAIFLELWEWRFPVLLRATNSESDISGGFVIRRALEPWPLLSETPVVGGTTSRFIDTSIERIEVTAEAAFANAHRIYFNGRELQLRQFQPGVFITGLRFRSGALFPSLHPAQPIQTPLKITLTDRGGSAVLAEWTLANGHHTADAVRPHSRRIVPGEPCRRPFDAAFTCDLRL